MIIVTGCVQARAEASDEASGGFVTALGDLAAEPPTIELFDAQPLAL